MHSEEEENLDRVRQNYLPFAGSSILYMMLVSYTDLTVFGIAGQFTFYSFLPAFTIIAMSAVIFSSLKIRFNPLIIAVLAVEVLLLVPSLFLLLTSIFTGKMNIDFFRTLIT